LLFPSQLYDIIDVVISITIFDKQRKLRASPPI
jgi:hypothetical protein